jgi:hypothetical protein
MQDSKQEQKVGAGAAVSAPAPACPTAQTKVQNSKRQRINLKLSL